MSSNTPTRQRFSFGRHPFTSEVLARPALRALVPARDELERTHAAFLRADELLNAPTAPVEAPVLDVAYRTALEAGQPLPKGLGAQLVKAQADAAVRDAEVAALLRVHNTLGLELTLIVEESVEAMAEGLHAELTALIDHAAEQLDALGGSIDPLKAMRTKKAVPFQALAEDHEHFLRIRSDADLLLVQEADRGVLNSDHALFRIMRNAGSVWTDWKIGRDGPQRDGVMVRYEPAPWPADITSLEFFAWLVANRETAQPWVPTYAQMQAAHAVAVAPAVAASREPTTLAAWHGGEERALENSATAAGVRNHGAADRARDADMDSRYVTP